MARLIVMVTGSAPGVGKSSLAAVLARRWRDRGLRVEFFDEADILGRDEFAELIGTWRCGGRPSLDVVLAAAAGYLKSCRAAEAHVYVQDALFPFLASLLAWGYSDEDITDFFTRLDQLAVDFGLVQIHLVGRPQDAISRAVGREGPGWLETMMERARSWAEGERVTELASLVEYFSATDVRAQSLLRRAPWASLIVDVDRPQSDLQQAALELLDPVIGAVGRGPLGRRQPGDGERPLSERSSTSRCASPRSRR
jgi:hypothetical protein